MKYIYNLYNLVINKRKNKMKKFFLSFICLYLAGCGALESDFEPKKYGPMLQVYNQKLPSQDVPKKITYLNNTYYLLKKTKNSGTGNINDKRAMIYTQNPQSASYNDDYFIIMDDIVANEKDAYKIFQSQVGMRSTNSKIFRENNTYYSFGTDIKSGLGYLVVGTYDELTHVARNRFYLILLNKKNNHLVQDMKTHSSEIVQRLLAIF